MLHTHVHRDDTFPTMRLTSLICILMLLVAQHRAELQGPLEESASATTATSSSPAEAERETITSSEYSSSKTESDEIKTAEKDAKAPPAVDSQSKAKAPGANDRKAAKLKDNEFAPRTKVMPAALLERLWNDSLMKQQKLKAQIEAIEAKMTPVEVKELTPEQMEGT